MGKAVVKQSLPDLPSQLIRTALADLNAVERMPGYTVDMGTWHEPNYTLQVKGVAKKACAVCFAGSVMANSLKTNKKSDASPDDYSILTKRKLRALDDFRMGDVNAGLEELRIDSGDVDVHDRCVTDYEVDKPQFKRDMKELANDLEAVGY